MRRLSEEAAGMIARLPADTPRELAWFRELAPPPVALGATRVCVLGHSFPEELIYACGAVPRWILGGSPCAAGLADDRLPRDADPVSRAMLGELLADPTLRVSPVLVPLTSDGMRKLAFWLMRTGWRVCPVALPAVRADYMLPEWKRQLEESVAFLRRETGRGMTARSLAAAAERVRAARAEAQRFLRVSGALPGAWRTYVPGSYYRTEAIDEWCSRLRTLNDALRRLPPPAPTRCRVLLMGSPVLFPNYKIPLLLEEAGLELEFVIDGPTMKVVLPYWKEDAPKRDFDALALAFGRTDCSAASVRGTAMERCVRRLTGDAPADGVIYHVLKGQLEPDFELARYERFFEQRGLPVLRLETLYSDQDVEQLRIRLEAFGEMLARKRGEGCAN